MVKLFLSFLIVLTFNSAKADLASTCVSVEGRTIPHFEKSARADGLGKKILVLGQIHGDEPESGELAESWIKRLEKLEPSNTWRIIPLVNPDGVQRKTRTNANGVDLNRNFPTKDWAQSAVKRWNTTEKENPRRNPGKIEGSEPEIKCLIAHIEEFRPDLIVSIHTPYNVLDFDGPVNKRINMPGLLPWRRLGTFPGSLGRYMWDERKVPVLTIELGNKSIRAHESSFNRLQDLLSDLI